MFDMTPAFIGLTKPFTIERVQGMYQSGEWVESGRTTTTDKGVVQPVSRGEINNIGIEGLYTSEFIKIYSNYGFKTTGGLKIGDFVVIDSKRFIVRFIDDWQEIGNYSRAICELYDINA